VGAEHILGSFTDAALITELAKKCDVITVEIEHVNADAVAEAQRASGGLVRVEPSPSTVALIQDKFLQKELMGRNGVPVGDFRAVETQDDVLALAKVGRDAAALPTRG
jgi:phosphoribosylaminoimidazole carboxylase